jgi:hypothetical protein
MGLVLAPLAIGYAEIGPTLLDVAAGLLACILTLAALDAPGLRFLNLLPAAWLLWTGQAASATGAGLAEVAAGLLLLGFAFVPRARLPSRLAAAERQRAGIRA